ncbi:uncharacterized protein [Bos taurus]|uniref:uncharacterized protein n=1 Tax=Bos taurus TaxID=9913 RepID=UPI0028CBB8EA|nr:uncharacterized protein LOC132346188 [Bos taurus]
MHPTRKFAELLPARCLPSPPAWRPRTRPEPSRAPSDSPTATLGSDCFNPKPQRTSQKSPPGSAQENRAPQSALAGITAGHPLETSSLPISPLIYEPSAPRGLEPLPGARRAASPAHRGLRRLRRERESRVRGPATSRAGPRVPPAVAVAVGPVVSDALGFGCTESQSA